MTPTEIHTLLLTLPTLECIIAHVFIVYILALAVTIYVALALHDRLWRWWSRTLWAVGVVLFIATLYVVLSGSL